MINKGIIQQVDDECGLCGTTVQTAKLKPLYAGKVCGKCRSGFVNRRLLAFIIDFGVWFVILPARHRKRIMENGPGFVFCRLDGRPIQRIDSAWQEALRLAGLKGFHFHDLRHTFCSNLLLSGSDLKDVKEMIGHKDLSMTDRYAHLTPSHKLLRQEQLARFYSSTSSGS
jgi:hypothetical protein